MPVVQSLSSLSARKALFYVLAVFVVVYPFLLDRGGMIDQINYIDYFANAPDLTWPESLASPESVVAGFLRFFTEEAVWLIWTTALGFVLPPDFAVRFTVAVISLLIVLAAC